jgi:hypothetical protein
LTLTVRCNSFRVEKIKRFVVLNFPNSGVFMAIIDLDSHVRDGWLLDEIYKLPEPFAKYSPKRIGDEKLFLK